MRMTAKERVLKRERDRGHRDALELANRAHEMNGTALIAEQESIPLWREDAVYGSEHVGYPIQDMNQVFTILQPHTPSHNPGVRPADLPAIYSRKNTTDPKRAKKWLAPVGVSGVYSKGDCAVDVGRVFRSVFDGANVWRPSEYPVGWEDLGSVEEVQGDMYENY